MNTLKVTKWFGFTLLCLGILSTMLALAGLWAARGFQDSLSQVNSVQEAGEQIDLPLPGREAAQTGLDTGKDADQYYLAGAAKVIDPHRIRTISESSAVDPSNGGHYYLAGWAKMVDNTGRIQG
jgi:hypothetical protein